MLFRSRGKTYVATHLSKPFVIACESGLNALSGVKYNRVNNWADMKKIVKQFTSKQTVERARQEYDTICIDEVYASSIFCQDYIMSTYGDGALTLSDSNDPRKNLYQLYEKEYFRVINQLLSCDYTVVFIGHEQADSKTGFITPKGDKRCLGPIIDNSDFVIYLTAGGINEDGERQLSTAHFVETKQFFARSRFTECVPELYPFTAEGLERVIKDVVEAEEKKSGVKAVEYDVQKEQNISAKVDYDQIMSDIQELGELFVQSNNLEILIEIIEDTLGKGKKVQDCTKKQIDALCIIYDDMQDKAKELGILKEEE